MEKELMKIAEFAEFCGISRDTLLWYDKNNILKPAVVGENGYRYYRMEQFFRYDLISILKQTGSSLKEIKVFLKERNLYSLQTLFVEKEKALEKYIAELVKKKTLLDKINASIALASTCTCGVPELVTLPDAVLAVTEVSPEDGWFSDNEGEKVCEHLRNYAHKEEVIRYPLGSVVSANAILNGQFIEKGFFFPAKDGTEENIVRRKAGEYVQIFHKGSLDNVMATMHIALDFIKSKGLQIIGDIYEYDLLTFLVTNSEEDFIFQFLFPVIHKRQQLLNETCP